MNPKTSRLTDTGEDSKLVHRRKRPKVDASIILLFFRRVRATSMTQRQVENTRVHLWTFSPVSVKTNFRHIRVITVYLIVLRVGLKRLVDAFPLFSPINQGKLIIFLIVFSVKGFFKKLHILYNSAVGCLCHSATDGIRSKERLL